MKAMLGQARIVMKTEAVFSLASLIHAHTPTHVPKFPIGECDGKRKLCSGGGVEVNRFSFLLSDMCVSRESILRIISVLMSQQR